MKKQIFLLSIVALVSANVAKSQCGTALTGPTTTTQNNVPVFGATNGCVIVSKITDNGTGVGINSTAIPQGGIGLAKLAIDGVAGSSGPHVQFTTTSDDYPLLQILPFTHDNVSLNFDAYFDGTNWKIGDASPGSGFSIYKATDRLNFNYATGNQASTITWTTGMNLNTSGNVGINKTNQTFRLDVAGDVNVDQNSAYFLGGTGNRVLWYNSTATNNIFVGVGAGTAITTGTSNAFFGNNAGNANTSGSTNTFVGGDAGDVNTTGAENVFVGRSAGGANTTGTSNTFIGVTAGSTITTGGSNTCIGNSANVTAVNSSNRMSLGAGASCATDNEGFIGNGAYTTTRSTNGIFAASDARFKSNIQENVKGLEFIMKLRPVTYKFEGKKFDEFHHKNDLESWRKVASTLNYSTSEKIVHSGFIAQEVEKVANEVGYNFGGLHTPENADDSYCVNYADFVVPIIKAMQEQQAMIASMQAEIATLKGGIYGNDAQGNSETTLQLELANASKVILYDAQPNPFSTSTVIRYFIPENISGNAFVAFHDMYGNEVNKIEITEKGFGKIEANTANLASGVYSYSIMIDGKSVDTKKMLRSK